MPPPIALIRLQVEKIVADALERGCDPEALYQTLAELSNDWSDELEKIDDAKCMPEPEEEPAESPFKSPLPPSVDHPFWLDWK